MSFRILNQAPQYLLADGRVNAGGFLFTYDNNTTTPKLTWSDEAMTIPNPNPIPLDSAGRTNVDVWGDGVYSVQLTDALLVPQWTRDDVRDVASGGSVFPPGTAGQFLTTDGTNVFFGNVRQVPDPTGQANEFLTTDGTNLFWNPIVIPTPDIEVLANSFRANKFLLQRGGDTCPASGLPSATRTITFPTVYASVWQVMIQLDTSSQTNGPIVWECTSAPTNTGVTIRFDMAESTTGPNITNPIPFHWTAIGVIP